MVPVEAMPIKSLIVSPESGQNLNVGPVTIHGVAWAGEARVAKVELSMDEGNTWGTARLSARISPMPGVNGSSSGLRRFQGQSPSFAARPMCMASNNRLASLESRRFLWNGWDRVTVQVNAS